MGITLGLSGWGSILTVPIGLLVRARPSDRNGSFVVHCWNHERGRVVRPSQQENIHWGTALLFGSTSVLRFMQRGNG